MRYNVLIMQLGTDGILQKNIQPSLIVIKYMFTTYKPASITYIHNMCVIMYNHQSEFKFNITL